MTEGYTPPFHMTEGTTSLTIEIGQYVGAITAFEMLHPSPVLRRENRIRSIHSSLAIEQNTLTLDQVTDVIDGRRVLGPPQDIREVKNAYEVYEAVANFDPCSEKDLLRAHKMMMDGLVTEAGRFRSGNVGIYDGKQLIHAGTPAKYVPELMEELFTWLKKTKYHPLIKSCIFHYEFEFIHPFADGNGRTGRLWQSLILQKWQPIFAWLPIETLVHENQREYYRVLQIADNAGESTLFVEFMLRMIRNALQEVAVAQEKKKKDELVTVSEHAPHKVNDKVNDRVNDKVNDREHQLLTLLREDPGCTVTHLAEKLCLSRKTVSGYLQKLQKKNIITRVGSSRRGYWNIVKTDGE